MGWPAVRELMESELLREPYRRSSSGRRKMADFSIPLHHLQQSGAAFTVFLRLINLFVCLRVGQGGEASGTIRVDGPV